MKYPDLFQANAAIEDALQGETGDSDPRILAARREGLRLCREYATDPKDVWLDVHFPKEIAGFAQLVCERLNAAAGVEPWAEVRQPVSPDYITLTLRIALTAPAEILDQLEADLAGAPAGAPQADPA